MRSVRSSDRAAASSATLIWAKSLERSVSRLDALIAAADSRSEFVRRRTPHCRLSERFEQPPCRRRVAVVRPICLIEARKQQRRKALEQLRSAKENVEGLVEQRSVFRAPDERCRKAVGEIAASFQTEGIGDRKRIDELLRSGRQSGRPQRPDEAGDVIDEIAGHGCPADGQTPSSARTFCAASESKRSTSS